MFAARRKREPGDEEATCPVCNDIVIGSTEEVADHVDACLRQVQQGFYVVCPDEM